MRCPQRGDDGDGPLGSAYQRLQEARIAQKRLEDICEAAGGTSSEREKAQELSAGRALVAASDAWLAWIERGH